LVFVNARLSHDKVVPCLELFHMAIDRARGRDVPEREVDID
jgi:hypothetical protein